MALCTTPSCGCALTSSSLTITQVGSVINLEQASDSEITQLRDDLDALQAAFDIYVAANDAAVAAVDADVATLMARVPAAASFWTTPINAGITQGSGTLTAYKYQVGSLMSCWLFFSFGAGSAITAAVDLNLPVSGIAASFIRGAARVLDSDTGTDYWTAVYGISTGIARVEILEAASTYVRLNNLSSTVPMTWATSDTLALSLTYPVS